VFERRAVGMGIDAYRAVCRHCYVEVAHRGVGGSEEDGCRPRLKKAGRILYCASPAHLLSLAGQKSMTRGRSGLCRVYRRAPSRPDSIDAGPIMERSVRRGFDRTRSDVVLRARLFCPRTLVRSARSAVHLLFEVARHGGGHRHDVLCRGRSTVDDQTTYTGCSPTLSRCGAIAEKRTS